MKYVVMGSEIEAMQWLATDQPPEAEAADIVAWVNANGGEARYEPAPAADYRDAYEVDRGPFIRVRRSDGWVYAEPGHYVVMGIGSFYNTQRPTKRGYFERIRDFYVLVELDAHNSAHC